MISSQTICTVKTRIPISATSFFTLFRYTNDHLALVFNLPNIVSKSLDARVEGETERDRAIRGASHLSETGLSGTGESRFSPDTQKEILVRVHSCCLTGETLFSSRCDCKSQLNDTISQLSHTAGVVVYMNQEGRGIGLEAKLKAYNLIDMGCDTVDANLELGFGGDERGYGEAAEILKDLGISNIKLLTNNMDKVSQLQKYGINVTGRVPSYPSDWKEPNKSEKDTSESLIESLQIVSIISSIGHISNGDAKHHVNANSERDQYLLTKIRRMGHLLDIPKHLQ